MIHNDDELNVVRRQLERAEAALLSLRRDVLPKDQINELRSQIEEYLGIAAVADINAEAVVGVVPRTSDAAADGDV